MVSRQIIRPGDQGDVRPHEHDASDISGTFNFLRILKALIDGDITITGFLRTGLTGNRIEIRPSDGSTVASITLFTGAGFSTNEPFIETQDLGSGVWGLRLIGPVTSDVVDIQLRSDGVMNLNAQSDAVVSIDGAEVARITADGLVLAAGEYVQAATFRTRTGPDASDYWDMVESTDSYLIRQWDNSAGAFLNRFELIGKGTGVTNQGDFILYDMDGVELLRWDESADEFVFAKPIKLNSAQVGVWQDWTPTFTGLANGNGTVTARYTQIGKTVRARFTWVLGSSFTIGAGTISLPVTASTTGTNDAYTMVGKGIARDAGTAIFDVGWFLADSTNVRPRYLNNDPARYTALSSTAPFTWVEGDILTFDIEYEAA